MSRSGDAGRSKHLPDSCSTSLTGWFKYSPNLYQSSDEYVEVEKSHPSYYLPQPLFSSDL